MQVIDDPLESLFRLRHFAGFGPDVEDHIPVFRGLAVEGGHGVAEALLVAQITEKGAAHAAERRFEQIQRGRIRAGIGRGLEDQHEVGLIAPRHGDVEFRPRAPRGDRHVHFSLIGSGKALGERQYLIAVEIARHGEHPRAGLLAVPEAAELGLIVFLHVFRLSELEVAVHAAGEEEGRQLPEGEPEGLVFAGLDGCELILDAAGGFVLAERGGRDHLAEQIEQILVETGGRGEVYREGLAPGRSRKPRRAIGKERLHFGSAALRRALGQHVGDER